MYLTRAPRVLIFLLRATLGWYFLYQGIARVQDSTWSATSLFESATYFISFFEWLTTPQLLPVIDFLFQWGYVAVGIFLILGLFVKAGAVLGAFLSLLLYVASFTIVSNGFLPQLVDQHLITMLVLLFFIMVRAGRYWGLDARR